MRAGRRPKRTLANNTFTVYDYDNADQLTSIWHQRVSGATNTISRYEYGYDDAGNRTNMVGTAGSAVRSESYSYDAQDQLIGVTYKTGSVTERIVSYRYDAAGNRTGMVERVGGATNTTTYTANSDNQLTSATATRQGLTVTGYVQPGPRSNKWYASTATARGVSAGVSQQNGTFALPGVPVTDGANALTVTVTDVSGNVATQVVNVTVASGATALGYDANGNQTNDAVWSYSYDRENRLLSATSASLALNYSYDALGRLIERRTSGATTTTNRLYYAGWQLVAEYNGAGALQRKYVYGPGIDEPVRMTIGGMNYYYHADGLGSVTEITDSSGLKNESYTYDVYGTPTFYNVSGVVTNTSVIGNRLLFTARDRDSDTGWYNYRYRYYNPTLGRFVQPDPINIASGDLNLYRYVRNASVGSTDAFGLAEGDWWDPRSYLTVGQQLDPFNLSGSFAQSALSISDALGGILARNWEQVAEAYKTGPLGQTECDPVAHKLVQGSLIISGTAAVTGGGLIILGAAGVTSIGSANIGWRGGEIIFTRPGAPTPDWRFNPLGGSGYPPHYHRRGPGGIGRHRPWQSGPGGLPGRF